MCNFTVYLIVRDIKQNYKVECAVTENMRQLYSGRL